MKKTQSQPHGLSAGSAQAYADRSGTTSFLGRHVPGVERWLLRRWLSLLNDPPVAFVLRDGEVVAPPGVTPIARALVPDRAALLTLLLYPYHFFGDGYAKGQIDLEGDLIDGVKALYASLDHVGPRSFLQERLHRWMNRPKRNSLAGSRENIHHHYDIGNDFYRLWLDQRMVYTCAYYRSPTDTLEQAQLAKMDLVARKLRLRPGQSVVEAGCGWGSLALHMAGRYGVKVRAFNISHEQIAYARERAQAEGLSGQVEFVEDDYRNISGKYDAFVSVGMLEHVGTEHYRELGRAIRRSLKEHGLGLIHSIGRNRPEPMNPWIEQRIFPGSYPPSLGQMMEIFTPHGFSVLDVENLRLHYARTCEHWLKRFEQNVDRVVDMFDLEFARTWRIYLAGSVAAFLFGSLQLFQVVFAFPRNNEIPRIREDIYTDR
ncbi:MAG: class I SAM-dependent methyltransferase [Gammaproteobacteria bacterium]|nr:class I SAM-dependent methyltransferase [Gammaproteobacteria bacterium]NIR82713.1 class I SAM-dependent methyltransferase [Gammaproteobacteria bacterium]NIR89577.1 class I SAM-dependent methyltransferase [Gammaproteobacteria bacterium]NIU03873.1 class I SAM-dependent methyltransferase [Gammaproteobacteria bacterium]NIV51189.1 methyltransferase domain-containing protein [Gammaproteobacteria bacterium]